MLKGNVFEDSTAENICSGVNKACNQKKDIPITGEGKKFLEQLLSRDIRVRMSLNLKNCGWLDPKSI